MRTRPARRLDAEDLPARVTVVVATRNRRDELVASLGRHEAPVIVVDNASTDGSAASVRAAHPHVHVVELPRNVGAAARTVGVRLARTPYVAFADDDSWWAPGALARAAAVFDAHPRLGLIAGSIAVGPEERVALDLHDAGWRLSYVPEVRAHHHPSPSRSSPGRRRSALVRSSVLTALMRRPWRVVAHELSAALRGGRVGRRGLRRALPQVPAALRARKRLAPATEAALAVLRAPGPAPAAPGAAPEATP